MVIITEAYGDHSNRLFQAIHIESFCIEHGVKFWNPTFRNMAGLYRYRTTIFDAPFIMLIRILKKLHLIKPLQFDDLDAMREYEEKILERRTLLIGGWSFREYELTRKHRNALLRRYSIRPENYSEDATYQRLATIDRDKHAIVGVHIRRGDYKEWQGGRYYFDDEVYTNHMKSLSRTIERELGKSAFFILFSNEPIGIAQDEHTIISGANWYVDHQIMSECDFLIGPPSTFTLWASFIGKAKYFHLQSESDEIRLSDFQHCLG